MLDEFVVPREARSTPATNHPYENKVGGYHRDRTRDRRDHACKQLHQSTRSVLSKAASEDPESCR